MSEELALQQLRRNGGTVQGDKRAQPSGTEAMDGTRDQFLARARLSQDQNRRVGGRDGLNLLQDPPKGVTAPHNPVNRSAFAIVVAIL
jgi:hypothetical protein